MSSGRRAAAGVVGSVDLSSLETMKLQYEEGITSSRARGKEFCRHRDDYKKLFDRLTTLPDKTSHTVMVPFTKKAFMPGHLVHTNEILVLLGDNWFAERSAKQAREICQRRIDRCDETVAGIEKEIVLYESWLKEANQLKVDAELGEGNIEIREDLDEAELERWRRDRREKVRAAKLSEKQEQEADDDEYWKRLEELEMKEELDEYLEKSGQAVASEDDVDDDDDDDDEEDDDDELESDSDEDGEDESSQSHRGTVHFVDEEAGSSSFSGDSKMAAIEAEIDRHFESKKSEKNRLKSLDRKVSFGSNTEHVIAGRHDPEPSIAKNVILFDHTDVRCEVSHQPGAEAPVTPGDLLTIYGAATTSEGPKKSILKQTSYPEFEPDPDDDDDDIEFTDPADDDRRGDPTAPAVTDVVQERDVGAIVEMPTASQQSAVPVKKPSLFKQRRQF